MLPAMHQQFSSHQQNTVQQIPPQIPYSLLTAFYNLSSSSNIKQEIQENSKMKHASRSYNPGRPLCIEDRQRIVRLYEEGNRVSHIARLIGVTHSCVSKIMSRYRRTGSVQPRSFRACEAQENENWTKPEEKLKLEIDEHVPKEPTPLPFSIERILSQDQKLKKKSLSNSR